MEPSVDLPGLAPPPAKSYWNATTQRHRTSERSWGGGDARWCEKMKRTDRARTHCISACRGTVCRQQGTKKALRVTRPLNALDQINDTGPGGRGAVIPSQVAELVPLQLEACDIMMAILVVDVARHRGRCAVLWGPANVTGRGKAM